MLACQQKQRNLKCFRTFCLCGRAGGAAAHRITYFSQHRGVQPLSKSSVLLSDSSLSPAYKLIFEATSTRDSKNQMRDIYRQHFTDLILKIDGIAAYI